MLTHYSLGDVLLEKETIGLPEIVKVLGERPYGMNEAMKEYLEEQIKREAEDAAKEVEDEDDDDLTEEVEPDTTEGKDSKKE